MVNLIPKSIKFFSELKWKSVVENPVAILSVANYFFLFGLLQDMKRPFTPMKNLDMGEVISGIIDKIK